MIRSLGHAYHAFTHPMKLIYKYTLIYRHIAHTPSVPLHTDTHTHTHCVGAAQSFVLHQLIMSRTLKHMSSFTGGLKLLEEPVPVAQDSYPVSPAPHCLPARGIYRLASTSLPPSLPPFISLLLSLSFILSFLSHTTQAYTGQSVVQYKGRIVVLSH